METIPPQLNIEEEEKKEEQKHKDQEVFDLIQRNLISVQNKVQPKFNKFQIDC